MTSVIHWTVQDCLRKGGNGSTSFLIHDEADIFLDLRLQNVCVLGGDVKQSANYTDSLTGIYYTTSQNAYDETSLAFIKNSKATSAKCEILSGFYSHYVLYKNTAGPSDYSNSENDFLAITLIH